MSAAPAKRKPAAPKKKAPAAKPVAKKSPAKKTAVTKPAATIAAAVAAPKATTTASSDGPIEVCPRCGTTTFGPEERTRWEGRRTVRFSVLVCERGHTFAHPVPKPA